MARMRSFIGSWDAQAPLFVYWLSFAAEPSFDFDVDEPGSRRGAEPSPDQEPKVSERSEFFGSRRRRAPQGIRPLGPNGGRGDSVFAYFLRPKSKAHQLTQ